MQILFRRFVAAVLLLGGILSPLPAAAQESLVKAGALLRNGAWEVGVTFTEPVSRNSAIVLDHYSIPGADILGLRYVELNGGVVLTVGGLTTNSTHTLSVTNLQSATGAALPPASAPFLAKDWSWVPVGGRELGFAPDAVGVGNNGFDLIGGGIQMRDFYDESTFAFEKITGNFDRKVRVILQEPSSIEARAGLMMREFLDEGKERPAFLEDINEAFSRYIQIHVNPTGTAYTEGPNPVPGGNQYQAIARFYTGGINHPTFEGTETLTNSATAPYPNAWMRLRRRGQTFTLFRGNDGTNWTQLGSYTFPSQDVRGALSDTVHVGPNFSPEAGNISLSSDARRAFLAQFRDYGMVDSSNEPSEPPTLRIIRSGNEVEISWDGGGLLQTSTTLAPTSWLDVPNSSSPYRTLPNQQHRFYRARF